GGDRGLVSIAGKRGRLARDRCRTGRNRLRRRLVVGSNRRDFIKFVVAGAVASGCPMDQALFAAPTGASPIIEGEDNKICHQVRDGKVFSRPPASAKHDVVIVGGGMSGLTCAHLLQDRDFLLLEKEPHLGGNAYMMEYEGQAYGTGSAFADADVVVQ